MAVRPRLPAGVLPDVTLRRISGVTVHVMTCAALAAVSIGVLKLHWLPLLEVSGVGGLATLLACLWLASRAFSDAPFEHALVWFGMSTGTLPMGLALLRTIDPELRSPAAPTVVLGSTGSIPFAIPVLMVLVPGAVAAHPEGYPLAGWGFAGSGLRYAGAMLAAMRWFGALRVGSALRLWALSPWAPRSPAGS